MKSTIELYQFQKEDVRRINEFDGRCLIANEVGLGKTITSLYWAWKFLPPDPPGPTVVVCPSHLKIHWAREALKHLGIRVNILSGQRVPPDTLPPHNPNQIFVINYDILVPPHWKPRTKPPEDSWVAWLSALKPRLIIADEGDKWKNSKAATTRAGRRLCRIAPHVLILTGTPLSNKPPDLWSPLNLLRPELYPSQLEFNLCYTNAVRRWYGWEFKGAKNLEQLHHNLSQNVMIRRRKCDVLDQLPEVQHSVIPMEVDLTSYHQAESDFIGWLLKKAPHLAKGAMKATELSKLNYLKQMAGKLKHESIVKWSEDFLEESEGKLLLGAVHYSVTEPLLKSFGRHAVLVDGRMSDTQKNRMFDKFNTDPKCRILIGNMQAAGTGWSCRVSSDPTFVELPWTPGTVAQFIGRCHGINRGIVGTNTHARYLIAAGTIEEDMAELLQTKAGWADTAIDGQSGDNTLPIYSEVIRMMKRRHKK